MRMNMTEKLTEIISIAEYLGNEDVAEEAAKLLCENEERINNMLSQLGCEKLIEDSKEDADDASFDDYVSLSNSKNRARKKVNNKRRKNKYYAHKRSAFFHSRYVEPREILTKDDEKFVRLYRSNNPEAKMRYHCSLKVPCEVKTKEARNAEKRCQLKLGLQEYLEEEAAREAELAAELEADMLQELTA